MNAESIFSPSQKVFRQLFRYALIGVLTNLCGYTIYLLLTHLWGAPKLTMTLLYSAGALIGFIANRRFTFRHDGHIGIAGIRYLFVQLAGYLLNLFLLTLFVDWLNFSHQLVQAVAIIVVAIFLFVLSRVFVFAPQPAEKGVTRS
ncbi:GtrA family protein [Pseudomonas sp. B21-054]|uniref:GtrA family protein n=1 Tax=Pseudomonas sp. B21-054 TaxID=2895494 RepID=UPI00222F6187|nr:GtrA family protein [Pseudomonas sp. B21-054]UZE19666.1 GtrA family protein [Pseudomonas sp. B21-054]